MLIPRPDGRPTWFVHASAASRIGSRTDPSHCAPRRHVGAGETRDWFHLSGPCDHQDHRSSGGASPLNISPALFARNVAALETPVRSPVESTHVQNKASTESRKCLIFFGLRDLQVGSLWMPKCCNPSGKARSDTQSGNVNQHAHTAVCYRTAASALDADLDIAIGGIDIGASEERTGGTRREPPADQQVLVAQSLDDRPKPPPQVPNFGSASRE